VAGAAREYHGELFALACRRCGISQSMGRAGSCFDNAAAESFFSTLEWELLRLTPLATKQDARREVAGYIDWYNRTRRHSACGMRPPVEYEAILARRAVASPSETEAA
jgi:putative transposase